MLKPYIKDNGYFSKDHNIFEDYDEIFEPGIDMDKDEHVMKPGLAIVLGKEVERLVINPLTGKPYDILEDKDSVKIGFSFRRPERKNYAPPIDPSTGKPYEIDKKKNLKNHLASCPKRNMRLSSRSQNRQRPNANLEGKLTAEV